MKIKKQTILFNHNKKNFKFKKNITKYFNRIGNWDKNYPN